MVIADLPEGEYKQQITCSSNEQSLGNQRLLSYRRERKTTLLPSACNDDDDRW